MSDVLMTRLELNSRDFGKINERLRARLTPTNNIDGDGHDGHRGVPQSRAPSVSDGRDHPQPEASVPDAKEPSPSSQGKHLGRDECGADTADSHTGKAFACSSLPFVVQNQLPAPPQTLPTGLLSLFSEDVDESAGLQHSSSTSDKHGTMSAKWGGSVNGTSSSPQPSSSPAWEWPDISRGQQQTFSSSAAGPTRGKNAKTEVEYMTPFEYGSTAVRHSSRGYRAGRDGDDHTRFPAADGEKGVSSQAAEATGGVSSVEVERRTPGGGLEHVKKRLWGSMFEAAGASINRRRNGTNGANGGEGGKEPHQKTRRGNKRDGDNTAFSDNAVTTAVRGGVLESKNNIDRALRASRRSQFPPLPWLARCGVDGQEVADDHVGDEFGETVKHSHSSNDNDDQNWEGKEELIISGGGGARRGDRRSEKGARASTTDEKGKEGKFGRQQRRERHIFCS
ncbi:unnamed protein product [Ectocarpus sp. 4 AP-2014]